MKVGNHKFHTRPVAGTQAVAGDCAPSCTVEGQMKGPIHCNRDPQDHRDWDTTGLWPTIGDPRLDIVKLDDVSSKWDTLINAPTRSDFERLATQLIPREFIANHPSIEAHKNLVYGQAHMNAIVPYEDVKTRSDQDIPIINQYFDPFVYSAVRKVRRQTGLAGLLEAVVYNQA